MAYDLAELPQDEVLVPANRLSRRQTLLAIYIAEGDTVTEAGRRAGYSSKQASHTAYRRNVVQAEIARLRDEAGLCAAATKERMVAHMMRILESPASTASEKIRAATKIGEFSGFFRHPDTPQTVYKSRFDGMTLEELEEQERLYDRLEEACDERKTDS